LWQRKNPQMSEITRICAQCGQSSPLEARYCPHCGFDAQAGVPTSLAGRQLPAVIGRAAWPVLAGAGALVMRAAWKFLQHQLAQPFVRPPAPTRQPPAPATPAPARRPRRVIRIRSSWAVGDANGVWRQGSSDQTIEIEE
jgi:hypothetical protein